jgi:dihydrodipicolinate synthase/N-acetylneuraminate lyase
MNDNGVKKRYPQTILATACIPWKEDYSFNESVFRKFVNKLKENNLKHIYLFGTAGEGYAISNCQFEEIVKVFAEEMSGPGLHPIAGLISLSVTEMKERIDIAYNNGIREFMFVLPSWGSVSWSELICFLDEICTPYPDCKFIHYNNPRSKRLIDAKEYVELAKRYPNLAAVKYSTTDIMTIQSLMDNQCPLQYFITEPGFGYANMLGEAGLLLSISSINMRKAWEYFHASVKGDFHAALQFQREIYGVRNALINAIGTGRIDGAYDKIFCKMILSSYPLRLLPPYSGAHEDEFAEFIECLKSRYPNWLE